MSYRGDKFTMHSIVLRYYRINKTFMSQIGLAVSEQDYENINTEHDSINRCQLYNSRDNDSISQLLRKWERACF